jgi:N-carbamoylputrescine amidase
MTSPNPSRRSFLQASATVAGATAALGAMVSANPSSVADRRSNENEALPILEEIHPKHVEQVMLRSERQHEQLRRSLQTPGARPVKVGACQLANHCGGVEGKQANLARMIGAVRAAAAKRIQVLAFPEMCLPGYFTGASGTPAQAKQANHALADEPGKSQFLTQLQQAAKNAKMVLAFGFSERDGRHYYNSIGVIDADGAWLGSRRKNPLSPHVYETESFTEPNPALRSSVFTTRYAKVGVANCFDGEFPESIRRMRLDGAELLLWCNAGTGNPEFGHSSRLNASGCYAQSNRMWVVCCNAVSDGCYGTSLIIDPSGEPLVILPSNVEALGLATINLAATADWDQWRLRLDPSLRQ